MTKTTATTTRKKSVRRSAMQTCGEFKIQLLKAQILCMKEGEQEMAAACEASVALLSEAYKARELAKNQPPMFDEQKHSETIRGQA